jgi:hypothetical protein
MPAHATFVHASLVALVRECEAMHRLFRRRAIAFSQILPRRESALRLSCNLFKTDHSARMSGDKLGAVQLFEHARARAQRPEGTAIPPLRTGALNETHLTGTVAIHTAQTPGALAVTHHRFPVVRYRDASLRLPDPRACTSNPSLRAPAHSLPRSTHAHELLENETIGIGFDLLSGSLWGSP